MEKHVYSQPSKFYITWFYQMRNLDIILNQLQIRTRTQNDFKFLINISKQFEI
jgi:hypothetical protein